jgi:hypothetical protein
MAVDGAAHWKNFQETLHAEPPHVPAIQCMVTMSPGDNRRCIGCRLDKLEAAVEWIQRSRFNDAFKRQAYDVLLYPARPILHCAKLLR